jgi:uncharacterized membrane protein
MGILAMLIHSVAAYSHLPERIPVHFNAAGEPDEYGEKGMIWLLPVISILTYLLMTIINRFPHTFNYLVNITEANARYHYRTATRMIRTLKAVMMALLAYIHYATIQMALGKMQGLGNGFMVVFLAAIFATIGFFMWKSMKKNGTDKA